MTKNKIAFLTLALLSLGILTACETQTAENNEVIVVPNTPAAQTTATNNPEVVTPPLTVSADDAAYDSAIQLVDATFCKKISDPATMASCERDIASISTLKEAFAKNDPALCAKLASEENRKICETQIEAAQKAKAAQDELTRQGEDDVSKAAAILQAGDYTRCSELTLDSSKKDCETNVLLKKAQETSDASWCAKATIAEARELCQSAIKDLQAQG